MVVSTDSVVFKLLELYRRANRTCQKTCQGKLFVCTGLKCESLVKDKIRAVDLFGIASCFVSVRVQYVIIRNKQS